MTDRVLQVLSALSDPTRLAALRLLWDGEEHCVCELMQRLGASQSRMSRHMAVLKVAELTEPLAAIVDSVVAAMADDGAAALRRAA